ncbi:MAG: hypothetical protein ACP5E5_04980 [Acidobacteriaceae bacterium]
MLQRMLRLDAGQLLADPGLRVFALNLMAEGFSAGPTQSLMASMESWVAMVRLDGSAGVVRRRIVAVAFPGAMAFRLGWAQSPKPTPHGSAGAHDEGLSDLPQLVDITAKTGIHFDHLSSPENRYIVESMSGGVALIDYDRDDWPDIFFTNAPDVNMSLAGKKARSAL